MKLRIFHSPVLAGLFLGSFLGLAASTDSTPSKQAVPDSPAGSGDSRSLPSPRSADDEFGQIDTDGDGRVSAVEYASSPRSAADRIAEGRRNGAGGASGKFGLLNNEGRPDRSKLFRKLDLDRDGYLDRNELGLREASAGR